MSRGQWVPTKAKYFMISIPRTSCLSIVFYIPGEPLPPEAFPIGMLQHMLAIEDVKQQIRDKPLSDRVKPLTATEVRKRCDQHKEQLRHHNMTPTAEPVLCHAQRPCAHCGSVEWAAMSTTGCSDCTLATERPLSKYHREIKPGVQVDVYDVLGAFTGHYVARIKPMVDHLLKKLLAGGERGHKDLRQDMVDVRDTAQRAIDTIDEWS